MRIFLKWHALVSVKAVRHILKWLFCGLVFQMLLAPQAMAWHLVCNPLLNANATGPASINVDATKPVGSLLWQGNATIPGYTIKGNGVCTGTMPPIGTYGYYFLGWGNGTYLGVIGGYQVYDTGIPGIGVSVAAQSTVKTFPGVSSSGYGYNLAQLNGGFGTGIVTVSLIKTGNITQAGSLSGDIVYWGLSTTNTDFAEAAANTVGVLRWAAPIPVIPNIPTCSVSTSDVTVTLPTASVTSFGAVGSESSTPRASFNIGLTCKSGDPGTSLKAFMTITDKNNPANITSTLPIDPSSTGSGVGVRIYNESTGSPVLLGPDSSAVGTTNQWQVASVTAAGGNFTLPFSATYVKTSSNLVPGKITAYATFTMAYQ